MSQKAYYVELVLRDKEGKPQWQPAIGCYSTAEEAYAKRCEIARQYHRDKILSVTVRQVA